MESRGEIDPDEYLFLLTGGLSTPQATPNPAPEWLVDRWASRGVKGIR